MNNPKYFIVYKPFGILSQFSGESNSLKELGDFPKDVYPVGRLDKDSEGLLLITDDKNLNHRLLDPQFGHLRTYLVQVEGAPTKEAIEQLECGVSINVDGRSYHTLKAKAVLLASEPILPRREPPIRYRKNVPDAWIKLTLKEGKNRQVRKMTAAVGYPTLRLVRWSMEQLTIEGFGVGEIRQFEKEEIYALLGMANNPKRDQQMSDKGKSFYKTAVKKKK